MKNIVTWRKFDLLAEIEKKLSRRAARTFGDRNKNIGCSERSCAKILNDRHIYCGKNETMKFFIDNWRVIGVI